MFQSLFNWFFPKKKENEWPGVEHKVFKPELREPDEYLPAESVGLDNALKLAEWAINGEPQYGFGRVEFLGNRLAYTRTEAAIIVQDIFSGKVKKFQRAPDQTIFRLVHYICLTETLGLLLCYKNQTYYFTFVSLDLETCTYKFIGDDPDPVLDFNYDWKKLHCNNFYRITNNLLAYKTKDSAYHARLHFFELDQKNLKVEYQTAVPIPKNARWFYWLDGRIFFVRFVCHFTHMFEHYVQAICVINEDNTLTELENTETCFQCRYEVTSLVSPEFSEKIACWYQERLFVLCNFCTGNPGIPNTIFMSSFDLNTRQWTRINLNLPRIGEGYMLFNVNDNGLFLMHHFDETMPVENVDIVSYWISIRKPKTLQVLAWFKAQNSLFIHLNPLLKQ